MKLYQLRNLLEAYENLDPETDVWVLDGDDQVSKITRVEVNHFPSVDGKKMEAQIYVVSR